MGDVLLTLAIAAAAAWLAVALYLGFEAESEAVSGHPRPIHGHRARRPGRRRAA